MHTFTLPSGPEAGIVEMTGVEEDLLTNQRLIKTARPSTRPFRQPLRFSNRVPTGPHFRRFELRRGI